MKQNLQQWKYSKSLDIINKYAMKLEQLKQNYSNEDYSSYCRNTAILESERFKKLEEVFIFTDKELVKIYIKEEEEKSEFIKSTLNELNKNGEKKWEYRG